MCIQGAVSLVAAATAHSSAGATVSPRKQSACADLCTFKLTVETPICVCYREHLITQFAQASPIAYR
jgi:hypothetical protein